jgi:iron(III) transport system substrate-binding protein
MKKLIVVIIMLTLWGFAAAQSLTFYTAGPGGLANALAEAFTGQTGIAVEVYQATSGDVLARLEAERNNPRADVVVLASWGEGLGLAEAGYVAAYDSPEAANLRDGWRDGGLFAQGGAALAVVVNTLELAPEDYPSSWFDLLDERWHGELTMPDPTLSGSAAEFVGIFSQHFGDEGWALFRALAEQGLDVPGPNNAALNPVLSGEKLVTIAAVDYISYNQIAQGESLEIIYPSEGTVVALRPAFIQEGAPNREAAEAFIDFMLSAEGQALVAATNIIPANATVAASRPVPGEFVMLEPDWTFVSANITELVQRFRSEIVEGIIQRR